MKTHPLLIFMILYSASPSMCASNNRPNKRKYNEEKTSQLRSVVRRINADPEMFIPKAVSLVCDDGADPDVYAYNEFGSLLGACAAHDDQDATTKLLSHGANPDIQESEDGSTPLFFAKSPAMVRLLLDGGADLYRKADGSSLEDNSVLHNAAIFERSAHTLAALCEAGIDPNTLNGHGISVAQLILSRLTVPPFFTPEPEHEVRQSIGAIFWYGGNLAKGIGTLERHEPRHADRLRNFIVQVSEQQRTARKPLVLLAASLLNNATALGELVCAYWIPPLYSQDIDAWKEL